MSHLERTLSPAALKNHFLAHPFTFALCLTVIIFPAHHLIVPLVGVALFGISHGSRDHRLLTYPADAQTSLLSFTFNYLFRAAIFLGIWWLSPSAALAVFLVLSAEHFGACQFARVLRRSTDRLWLKSLAFTWGAFASVGASLFHWDESLPILQSILRSPIALSQIPNWLPHFLGVIMAALALVSAAKMDHYEQETSAKFRSSFWSTALLIVSFAALPLIAGFLLFFAFWHSVDSIRQQKTPSSLSWQNYFRQAFTLTSVSWLGLAGLFVWFGFNWGVFFVALGAVTLPHSAFMRQFYESQKKGFECRSPETDLSCTTAEP